MPRGPFAIPKASAPADSGGPPAVSGCSERRNKSPSEKESDLFFKAIPEVSPDGRSSAESLDRFRRTGASFWCLDERHGSPGAHDKARSELQAKSDDVQQNAYWLLIFVEY